VLVPPAVVFLVGMSGKLMAANLVPGGGQWSGWVNDWPSVLERSFWVQADLFTFGMVLAVLREPKPSAATCGYRAGGLAPVPPRRWSWRAPPRGPGNRAS
jgi:hypothetical protein